MRRQSLLLLAVLLPLSALAGKGKVYGEGVKEPTAVKVADLLANPDNWVGKKVRVEGVVTDVCPHRGCWLKLAAEKAKESETITLKVKDGVMVFPKSAKGKRADV